VLWTGEGLVALLKQRLGGVRLIVVANREPYLHRRAGGSIRCLTPASGLVTALDPVMRATGGIWVGHGGGDADRDTADSHGRLAVPPDDPSYTLRRVWLTREEEQGYYYGFANEALWPLCHIAYARPVFNASDWEQYRAVNRKFAHAVLEEIGSEPAVVFVQDYHFALLSRFVKEERPDVVVCQFWHIPWPNREAFRICPWQDEVLHGLLGNDLLGFHIQYHCNNFLDTVDRAIEARVDYEHFAITRGGKTTLVRPFPIGIDHEISHLKPGMAPAQESNQLRERLGIGQETIVLGVDRIDYTKGIPERLRAIDRLLDQHPELHGRFVFVQLGAPSRTRIKRYRLLNDEIDELVEEINWRRGSEKWMPIIFLREHHEPADVYAFCRAAGVCVSSSLHDGMNLVAKEYVAAHRDLRGVLVLSRFTGAARAMTDALLVNPYATDEFASTLYAALTMEAEEQEYRMRRLRADVQENNIYRWAGRMLSEACRLAEEFPEAGNGGPDRQTTRVTVSQHPR
jgi:trehalose 6-phosphate synthase